MTQVTEAEIVAEALRRNLPGLKRKLAMLSNPNSNPRALELKYLIESSEAVIEQMARVGQAGLMEDPPERPTTYTPGAAA